MDPQPDYGYDSYKGSGKLKDKVRCPLPCTAQGLFVSATAHPAETCCALWCWRLLLALPHCEPSSHALCSGLVR